LNTSSASNDSILVTWPPVEHAILYKLIMIREGSSTRLVLNTTDTTVKFDNLESGTSYCIKGMAWDAEGRIGDDLTVCQITQNIWVEEPTAGNCSVMWENVPLVDYYVAFIKRDDGTEKSCNTTKTTCQFFCMCGYTYLTSVFPYNQAGTSLFAHVLNYTTSENVIYLANIGSIQKNTSEYCI
ncbi:hypothetical protein XENOCAPTIV_004591, partial [Xenoophorus captivus]